jgi:hypothetical protein
MLLNSNGASIASNKIMIFRSQLYSQAARNISTLMAAKIIKISSESSLHVTGMSNGSYSTIQRINKVHHIVLQEAHSMIKKF